MPAQVPYSPGLAISRILATLECDGLDHEVISPDHSFCGITKLEDCLSLDTLKKLRVPPHVIPSFLAEAQQVVRLFHEAGIDPRQTRHELRERIGKGNAKQVDLDQIGYSEEMEQVFKRANDIAADNNAPLIMVHHLLAALLELSNTKTAELLGEKEVNIEKLREDAATLPIPMLSNKPMAAENDDVILDKFGIDLTEKARQGRLGRVIQRKQLEKQVVEALIRKKKNTPILVGKPGIGKTAIVEGLALRIASGNISIESFRTKRIIQVEASSLVEGTTYRGDMEKKIRQLIAAAAADDDIILFIDEIHQLIGAGGQSAMDAANMFKTALGRGEIKLIGATTDDEYRKFIEKDPALERRMDKIIVEEPSIEEAIHILSGLQAELEDHHAPITIEHAAIAEAVTLSVRYIKDRYLPDKAIDILDRACSRVQLGSNLSLSLNPVSQNIPGSNIYSGSNRVTPDVIKQVITEMTGIPVNAPEEERARIEKMPDALKRRVIGQNHAITAVTRIVQRYYSGLSNPNRPIGVFLFTGPTGVGKTELAKALAEFLFYDEKRIIRLDMSEYMEKHQVNRLIGSPPGYIGYDAGGQLTTALRQTPFCVVLIDEIEKADPVVVDIFLQIFDEGRLTDGQGRTVDATNAIFIMTSNLGYNTPSTGGLVLPPSPESVKQAVYSHFRPEFLNRIDDIVYFHEFQMEDMTELARLHLGKLEARLNGQYVYLNVSPEVIKWLAQRGYDSQMGARPLIRLIDTEITNKISGMHLKPTHIISVTLKGDALDISLISPDTLGF